MFGLLHQPATSSCLMRERARVLSTASGAAFKGKRLRPLPAIRSRQGQEGPKGERVERTCQEIFSRFRESRRRRRRGRHSDPHSPRRTRPIKNGFFDCRGKGKERKRKELLPPSPPPLPQRNFFHRPLLSSSSPGWAIKPGWKSCRKYVGRRGGERGTGKKHAWNCKKMPGGSRHFSGG